MTISGTVASLAHLLATYVRDTSPDPALLARLAQLEEMPEYVARERLDMWESELMTARADGELGPAHAAMVAILELGRINLYGEIDDKLTAEYLDKAITAMRDAGAPVVDTAFDVAEW